MNRLYYIILAVLSLFFSSLAYGQYSLEEGVIVHADPRLAVLLKKNHTLSPAEDPVYADIKFTKPPKEAAMTGIPHRDVITLYKGKGYRVQIYYGPDRVKAIQIKTEFMRHFPGIHTYLSYESPSFRVKAGDYRNRSDAAGMLREANSMYSPSMIVPDIVTVTNY